MRIEGFHVDRFRALRDAGVERFPRDLAVFVGANEAGKSTLADFFRWAIAGPPERSGNPSTVGSGSTPGIGRALTTRSGSLDRAAGRLTLSSAAGSTLTIERGTDTREPTILPVSARPILESALRGLDRQRFERVFAIGLEELQGLDLLSDERLRSRLLATGLDAMTLPTALTELDRRLAETLGGPRATRPRINSLIAQREAAEDRLRNARTTTDRYREAVSRRKAAEIEVEHLEEQIGLARESRWEIGLLIQASEPWARRQTAIRLATTLRDDTPLPADTLERYEAIRRRLADDGDRVVIDHSSETLESEPESQSGRRLTERTRRTSQRLWLGLVLLLGLAGVLALSAIDRPEIAVLVLALTVIAALNLWSSTRTKPEASKPVQVAGSARDAMRQLLIEAGVESESALLTRVQSADAIRSAEAETARQNERLSALLSPAGPGGNDEESGGTQDRFRARIAQLEQHDPAALNECRKSIETEIANLEEEKDRSLRTLGSIERDIEALASDHELATGLAERSAVDASLDRATEDWVTFALTKLLIEAARDRLERDHLPRLLAVAETFLGLMVGSDSVDSDDEKNSRRYRLTLDDGVLNVLDRRLTRRNESAWSRGLGDQVYLALRMATVLERAKRGEPLPLILDDVHVRFDPKRRQGLARALVELAQTVQVVVFSGQPELVDELAMAIRSRATGRSRSYGAFDARVFELVAGRIGAGRSLATI